MSTTDGKDLMGAAWIEPRGNPAERSPAPEGAREALEKMREALEFCAEYSWDGCDIDGGDFHDLMTRLGLFVEIPADEEYKAQWDGDTMSVFAWSALAYANGKGRYALASEAPAQEDDA